MASACEHTRSRPHPVSIATYLLYILAAVRIVFSLIPVALVDDLRRSAERAYAGTDLAATAAASAATAAGAGLVGGLLFAIVVAVLAFFSGEGRNWARIVVWVFVGGSLVTIPATVPVFTHGFFASKPDWYLPMTVAGVTINVLGLIAVSVLLAIPASRPFFRKPLPPTVPANSEPVSG